jgi:hypothetical protein
MSAAPTRQPRTLSPKVEIGEVYGQTHFASDQRCQSAVLLAADAMASLYPDIDDPTSAAPHRA